MIRLAVLVCLMATPSLAADSKDVSCGYQADVVAAIQKARLARVAERNVPAAIAKTDPTWPANYNNAIPHMTPWVYEMKRSVLRKEDLSAVWKELCLQQ